MAKGIQTEFKQPVGYFLSHSGTAADVLKDLLLRCYSSLADASLEPGAAAYDEGGQNLSVFSQVLTAEKPYIDVKGKCLFFLFDLPHLLKCSTNRLFK